METLQSSDEDELDSTYFQPDSNSVVGELARRSIRNGSIPVINLKVI